VPEYLQAADGFLFASESEALPLALLEALSTGLPAIASDIAAHHDIVTPGHDGWLAPCNDAAAWTRCLDDCVAQPERAREFGVQGRQTVMTRFSMPHVAAGHQALFQAVCVGRGAAT
jgi:glycosyltransferase involved in cell wall biosynthesis